MIELIFTDARKSSLNFVADHSWLQPAPTPNITVGQNNVYQIQKFKVISKRLFIVLAEAASTAGTSSFF